MSKLTKRGKIVATVAALVVALGIVFGVTAALSGSSSPQATPPAASTKTVQTTQAPVQPSGPFSVKLVTYNSSGAVVDVTNNSNDLSAAVQVTGEFLNGNTVEGQNVTTYTGLPIQPGQTEQLTIGNAGYQGDTFALVSYSIFSPQDESNIGTYQLSN
jgi:hypothetical protein